MQLHRPLIRHLDIDAPATSVPVDAGGFMWFTPARSVPAVAAALPHDAALLAWARVTLGLVLEVLARRRRIEQITPRITPRVARYLGAHLHTMGTARAPQLQLLSVRLFQPHDDAGELTAVYRTGRRAHALAARADRPVGTQTAWTLTALRLG